MSYFVTYEEMFVIVVSQFDECDEEENNKNTREP